MARESISRSLPIDRDLFKKTLKEHNASYEVVASICGNISRQSVGEWIEKGAVPAGRFAALTARLGFTPEQVGQILMEKPSNILVQYRTHRNKKVSAEIDARIKVIAEAYFKLPHLNTKQSFAGARFETKDPAVMASSIKKYLNLNSPIPLDSLISTLSMAGIDVAFINFECSTEEAQAAYVNDSKSHIIFVNTDEAIVDVPWRICHELCHIFAGHDEEYNEEDEEFSNDTATEMTIPSSYVHDNQAQLKSLLLYKEGPALFALTHSIANDLSIAFKSAVIMIKSHQLATASQQKYLWGCVKNSKPRKVATLFPVAEGSNLTTFWIKALNNERLISFYRLQNLVLSTFIAGKATARYAAQFFNVDHITMQEIATRWLELNQSE